jgi:hypothetical protein
MELSVMLVCGLMETSVAVGVSVVLRPSFEGVAYSAELVLPASMPQAQRGLT